MKEQVTIHFAVEQLIDSLVKVFTLHRDSGIVQALSDAHDTAISPSVRAALHTVEMKIRERRLDKGLDEG